MSAEYSILDRSSAHKNEQPPPPSNDVAAAAQSSLTKRGDIVAAIVVVRSAVDAAASERHITHSSHENCRLNGKGRPDCYRPSADPTAGSSADSTQVSEHDPLNLARG